jgi:hypothetical protein
VIEVDIDDHPPSPTGPKHVSGNFGNLLFLGDCMQKLHPWEVDVLTTPIGAHKPFVFSSSYIRVLDFTYVKKAPRASL